MYDPAQGFKDLLVADGVAQHAVLTGWNISLGRFPDVPDTTILINQTGGASPFPHLLLNFPSVQVIVRGSKGGYIDARNKVEEVVDSLLGIPAQEIGNDWWQGIIQLGEVGMIGYDENHRPLFAANFGVIIEPAAGKYRMAV